MSRVRAAMILLLMTAWGGWCQEPKKVTLSEAWEAAISKPDPVYPAIARQLKIEGGVDLEAVVNESGGVERVDIVSGNAVLTKSAVEALKKWKFRPFLAEGKPVKVIAPVRIKFKKE